MVTPKPFVATLYTALRSHSLNELDQYTNAELQLLKLTVNARIDLFEHHVRTHNLFKDRVSEINCDLRWYRKVNEDLAALLTARFHVKIAA